MSQNYNQNITLDLNTNTSYLVVGAKQGDNKSRTLTATILENGNPKIFQTGTTASYRIRKPDGSSNWGGAKLNIDKSEVIVTLTSQDLSSSGRCYTDISFRNGSTHIATVSFIIDVQAAPNIVEGALASEAFSYLYDMVDQAGSIIESSQAWAEGKRSTDDVLGDSYSVYATRGLEVSLDFDLFKQTIDPPSIGEVTVYSFTYTSRGWEYSYNGELIEDMSELGFTIVGNPDRGDLIEVTASFADPAWHNNSLYYRQRAEAWAVGTVDGTDVKDIYDLWHTDGLVVDFNYNTFKQVHPLVSGGTETYTFNYKDGNWQYDGQNVDMSSLGIIITAGRLTNDAKIIVTTSDDTYKNNAKYYKEESDRLGQSWATGFVNGVRIPLTDPAYKQNANWLAQTYATGEFNGMVVPTTDPTYKNNSKYYRDVIAASTVDEVTTANPGMPAQASAEFDKTDDKFEFDFTLPSVKPHATIRVTPLPYTEDPTASVQIHELSAEDIAEKKALPDGTPGKIYPGEKDNLQKSFDFAFGIPRGIYTGISNDVSVQTVNTLEPGTNAAVRISAKNVEVSEDKPREKQFTFEFDIPRGNTGATGAYLTDIQVVQNSLGEAKLQYKLSSDNFIWLTTIHDKTYEDLWSVYKDSDNQLWTIDAIKENRIKIINTNNYNNFLSTGTLTWVSGGINHNNIIYTASEQFIGDWREANGTIPVINGTNGTNGRDGINGINGQDGQRGEMGPQGPAGQDGIEGRRGSDGPTGATGVGIENVVLNSDYTLTFTYTDGRIYRTSSIRGPQGERGLPGATGDPGATGAPGPAGQDATSPVTITIGSVTEAAAGSPPSVTNSGTATNMVLDFVLPTGAAAVNIDDTVTSNTTVWSSQKVSSENTTLSNNITTINNTISGTNGINSKILGLQSAVTNLQTEVETAATGLLARTTSLETHMTTAETAINAANNNISSTQTAISNLNSKVGSGTISHSLGDNLVDAIDALWTQTFGTNSLYIDVESNKERIRNLQTIVTRIQPIIEDTTSGLIDRTAALENGIQTKQAKLRFDDLGIGELVIALA